MDRSTGYRFFGCSCCEPATSSAATGLSRRSLFGGLAAAGVAATIGKPAIAQAPAVKRIDVHHHFIPPFHRDILLAQRRGFSVPDWSVGKSLEDMDKGNVATAMLSINQPGVWFGKNDNVTRKLTRDCNEYAAKLAKDHPGRFGNFACLALPDIEGSLKEIEYSLDTLKADGIALLTSYQDKYLGDPLFVPVFEELNRRKAVVYVHPITPDCCVALVKGIPPGTIEYATDTTRTISSLLFGEAGTGFKFPDIKFIWSHSGGTLPFLTGRLVRLANDKKDPRMPNGPIPFLQKYYYEVAQGNTPGQLAALMKLVTVPQVMLGSDYPYRPATEAIEGLRDYGFNATDLQAIERDNALKLLPGVKGA